MTPRRDDATAAQLRGLLKRTYEALHRHPPPDDLTWGDVRALIGALAEVQDGRKGEFKATRRGVMATFHAGRDRELLSADERVEVQHFFERSNEGVSMAVVAEGTELLVAIDAEGARLYRIQLRDAVPRQLEPFHANGYAAELRSSHTQKKGPPEPVRLNFYKELARALRGVEGILLVACGDGGASALEALRAELERSHPEVARKVLGALALKVPKGKRASDEQLLKRTREFFAERG